MSDEEAPVSHTTLNMLFEKMGEVGAIAREAKHAANTSSQKIDIMSGKVDSLAIVVATQGHIKEDVEELQLIVKEQRNEINQLVADKHRREGAIGLVEWISRHWPFTLLAAVLSAVVLWANGKLGR